MPMRHTSIAASHSMTPFKPSLRLQMFIHILRKGAWGATLDEMEVEMGMKMQTCTARRKELEDRKLIEASTVHKYRNTRSGRKAKVWIVPEEIAVKARKKLEGYL